MNNVLKFPDPDRDRPLKPGRATEEEIEGLVERVSPAPEFDEVYRKFLGAVLGDVEADIDDDESY